MKADLRFCGICWGGKNGVRMHYCDLPLGHSSDGTDHKCHCGETLKLGSIYSFPEVAVSYEYKPVDSFRDK
jgi:hypothetical protein